MAEEGDSGEKTEAPSGRRITQSRNQGMTGQSAELNQVVGMIAAFYGLTHVTPVLWERIIVMVKGAFTTPLTHLPMTIPVLKTQFIGLLALILPPLLLIMFIAAFFGTFCSMLQTKFLFSWELVKPKMRMLNPVQGLKRIFSVQNSMNILKQLAKLAIIGPIAYGMFFEFVPLFLGMMDLPLLHLLPLTADMASTLFKGIMKYLLILALLDMAWQRWRNATKMKMSKQEHKDEKKSTEGDEASRRRIISLGLQRARDRMMQNVPQADVVVTNPTHIAVALQYSAVPGTAPKVIAKGKGFVAERIKEIARRHGVPVVERKPLARALFKMVEVGHEIPYELFKAVAEILAYVYRLKGRNPLKNRTTRSPGAQR